MNGPNFTESMQKKYACWHCPGACGAESVDGSDRGEFAFPQHTHRPEYETLGAFGVMNGVNNTDAMIAINHWCNEYGLETIWENNRNGQYFTKDGKKVASYYSINNQFYMFINTKAIPDDIKTLFQRKTFNDTSFLDITLSDFNTTITRI